MSTEWDRHERICDLLELLGSEAGQLQYEKDVPWVDITTELVCMWFDDTYHPDDSQYEVQFSTAELKALATFNELYDRRLAELPRRPQSVRIWLAHPAWLEIMQLARATLAILRRPSLSDAG